MTGYTISDETFEKATQDILSYIENTPVDKLARELEIDKAAIIANGVLDKMGIPTTDCNDQGIYLKNDDSGEYEKVTGEYFDFLLSDDLAVGPTTHGNIHPQKEIKLNITKTEKFVPRFTYEDDLID